MDDAQLDRVAALAGDLPGNDIARLAHAATGGIPALNELRGNSANDRLRTACQTLIETIHHGADPLTLAGALLGSGATARRLRREASVDVVWTGPTSEITTSRVTSAVIAELLDEACSEILLIGYAVHNDPAIADALDRAAQRQVAITLLLERTADNPGYHQHSQPFPTLRARRLAWPAANRPTAGAALHAKVLDIDRHTALVISANITRWALDSNLECGILIRGGDHPRQIHDHIDSLAALGILVPVAR
jgi:cardiolipin synthase A/B